MAWNEGVTQLTTSNSNHADNFNAIHNQLLENTKHNKATIEGVDGVVGGLVAGKVDVNTYNADKQAQAEIDAQQDAEISSLGASKVDETTYLVDKQTQDTRDTAQDDRMSAIEANATDESTRLDGKVDKKLTLNDAVTDTNFNLCEREVVQDGLIETSTIISSATKNITLPNVYTIMLQVEKVKSGWLILNENFTGAWGLFVQNDGRIKFAPVSGGSIAYTKGNVDIGEMATILISQSVDGSVYTCINNIGGITYNSKLVKIPSIGTRASDGQSSIKYIVYNRSLTPTEIQHNFQVLNNSPSINKVETEDAQGNKKKFQLATDSEHVVMRNGYNAEDAYVSLAKTMSKEFVSSDGSPVTISNGLDKSKILSLNCEGRTIKQLLSFTHISTISNRLSLTGINKINVNGMYLQNNTTKRIKFNLADLTTNGWKADLYVSPKSSLRVQQDGYISTCEGAFSDGWADNDIDKETLKNSFLCSEYADDWKYTNRTLPLGLSSTQAIIENNGMKYSFVEPIIKGETVVQKKLKTGGEWITIQQDETRDTVTYDYRLKSLESTDATLPKLGSVPSVSDTLDRASGVLSGNTEEIVLDETIVFIKSNLSNGNFTIFASEIISNITTINSNIKCNNFLTDNTIGTSQPTKEGISYINKDYGIRISIQSSKLSTQDVDGFKAWLQANPTTVRYQLATPTQPQLTQAQLATYSQHEKVISLPFAEDKVVMNEDGSSTWVDWSRRCEINDKQLASGVTKLTNTIQFRYQGLETTPISNASGICDKLNYEVGFKDNKHIFLADGNAWIHLLKSEVGALDTDTNEELIEKANIYLNNLHPITVIYKSAQVTTHLPKSITPTIPTQKENVICVGEGVGASSFKVSVPVDRVAEMQEQINAITAIVNTPSSMALQANYIDDEFNEALKILE